MRIFSSALFRFHIDFMNFYQKFYILNGYRNMNKEKRKWKPAKISKKTKEKYLTLLLLPFFYIWLCVYVMHLYVLSYHDSQIFILNVLLLPYMDCIWSGGRSGNGCVESGKKQTLFFRPWKNVKVMWKGGNLFLVTLLKVGVFYQ